MIRRLILKESRETEEKQGHNYKIQNNKQNTNNQIISDS